MAHHIVILGADGTLYVSGDNSCGQLGLGRGAYSHRGFVKVENIPQFSSVASSHESTFAVSKEDGSIWWCGNNGVPSNVSLPTGAYSFTKMLNTADFISVSCGKDFLIALDSHGKVWGLGSNFLGQLGLGTLQDTQRQLINNPNLSDITSAMAGGFHSLVLDINGIVRVFGLDTTTLENDTPNIITLPTIITPQHAQIVSQPTAIKIATGEYHSLVLCDNFAVWGFGGNVRGQLGLGKCQVSGIANIPICRNSVDIACGPHSSYITDISGNVWVMGSNEYGELALTWGSSVYTTKCEYHRSSINFEYVAMVHVCIPQINPHLYQKKLYPFLDSLLVADQEGFLYGCGLNAFGKLSQCRKGILVELTQICQDNVFHSHSQSSRIKSAESFIDVPAQ